MLIGLWTLVLFEFQWVAARYGVQPVLKLPTLLFLLLIIMIAIEVPSNATWRRRWQWFTPHLLLIATGIATLPVAMNRGLAVHSLKLLFLYWTLIVATVVIVNTPRRIELLAGLYGLSFIWYGLWGSWRGFVPWHYVLANDDGFGALMAVGVGLCSFLTVAAPKGSRLRLLMGVATFLSVTGVVASFARGAFLAAAGVGGLVWFRSQRKVRALAVGIAGTLLVVVAANAFHVADEFWAEMETSFTHGTSEGTNQDRWVLWTAAWQVFQERPLLGVGPGNFGPFAAQHFNVGELPPGGYGYTNNPGMLYNRSLHNIYMQILSEHGMVGILAFLGMLVHFWRRNGALRTALAAQRWRALGGTFNIRTMALGLEAAMVGYLLTAAVYGLLDTHWAYTIFALNLVLHSTVFDRRRLKRNPSVPRAERPLAVPGH